MKATQVAVVTPTSRERLSAARPGLLLVAFTMIILVAIALFPRGGYDDAPVGIRNKGTDGARALAQVLRDHGVSVREVSVSQAASVDDNTTLVVIFPSRMSNEVATALETRANVVYVGLEEAYGSFAPYMDGLRATRTWKSSRTTGANCSSQAAQKAHSLTTSDYVVSGTSSQWELCFPVDDSSYAYAERFEPGRFRALIPDSVRLRNRGITNEGNAALAINAIGRTPKVAWYSPTESDKLTDVDQNIAQSPYIAPAFLIVIGAGLLAAAARGRRLGPLTPERLPVEVPASETLIGKASLMRSRRAYDHAARALRSAAASRIATSLGVAHTSDRETLIGAIERQGLPASRSTALLWGPPPTSEAELVRLANDLDSLEKEIRHD
mgnify:FL=1